MNEEDAEYALNEGDKELFEEYAKQRKVEFEMDLNNLVQEAICGPSGDYDQNEVDKLQKEFIEKWGPK